MNLTENSLSSYEDLIPEFMPVIKGISASFPERYWEDLVQEGLIGLFNAVNSYSEETGVPFRAYANICIRNAIYSACRKIKDDTLTESLDDKTLPEEGDMASAIIEKNDTADFFAKLKDELSSLEAKILTEYLRDKSYAEISASLGVTSKTIDNSLTRIKGKIKKLYK